jgi:hypothetical protein
MGEKIWRWERPHHTLFIKVLVIVRAKADSPERRAIFGNKKK